MRMIREKVEQTLIETAQVCQKMNVPLRCLYIQLSDPLKDLVPINHQAVTDMVYACFNAHEIDAMGYVADDGDLFFLSRGMTGKILEGMIKDFPRHISENPGNIMHLYEMQVNAHEVIEICSKKIQARIDQNMAHQRALEAAKIQTRQDVQKNIEEDIIFNAGLLASFDQRRIERLIPGILVVEDDPFSQKLVANALREEADISVASSGRQALQVMMKSVPDMIFLDIGLPDVTGLEILDEIFRIDPNAHVVMLSGNGSRDNIVGAMQKGAKGFIGKPFTVEKLIQAVSKCSFIQSKRDKKGANHG